MGFRLFRDMNDAKVDFPDAFKDMSKVPVRAKGQGTWAVHDSNEDELLFYPGQYGQFNLGDPALVWNDKRKFWTNDQTGSSGQKPRHLSLIKK